MEIKTLEYIELSDLLTILNRAYEDYSLPIHMTDEQLRRKMIAENIDLSYSLGAFEDGQLVGFVLHGHDVMDGRRVLYNAATGIIPGFRGRGITGQFYDRLKARLEEENFDRCQLEVISNNLPAIKAYEKVGYKRTRELECFQGNAPIMDPSRYKNIRVKPLREKYYQYLPDFWNYQPTWQHNMGTIRRSAGITTGIGLFNQRRWMVAYGFIDVQTGRLKQFGVHPNNRRNGLGLLLFHHLGQLGNPELTILNVDTSDEVTIEFLRTLGFSTFAYQYEMIWEL
jgi:ribosomal protein S18 acetylase RimI-like enzyme